VKHGLIALTPGDVTDYEFIGEQIRKDLDAFDVQAIGFDPWNATQLSIDLAGEGAPMVEVRQGMRSMSPPLKECERLILKGTERRPLLRHGGNPVARWMTDNLRVDTDAAGNVKPSKKTSMDKIDGWSALVTAMAMAMAREPEQKSAYETSGLTIA